jgi:peroxiredoxin Q/BCP
MRGMSRPSFRAAWVIACLGLPVGGCAHDPLEDRTGEEDFTQKKDDPPDVKLLTGKQEKQTTDLKGESEELELVQFHINEEKEAFLRDKSESKEILEGVKFRDAASGRKGSKVDSGKPDAKPEMIKPDKAPPKADAKSDDKKDAKKSDEKKSDEKKADDKKDGKAKPKDDKAKPSDDAVKSE